LGSYAPTWIKIDPRPASLGSSKLLIKSVYIEIRRDIKEAKMRSTF